MHSARDELRDFTRQRNGVIAEGALGAVVAVALWAVAGQLEGTVPGLRAAFVGVLALFASAVLRWVQRVVPILLFRCPRCTRPFHAANDRPHARPVLRVRACAHCGLSLGSDSSPTAG